MHSLHHERHIEDRSCQAKRTLLTVACLLLAVLLQATSPVYSSAEDVAFSSSMNPVGSGARAAGMGGAFIAVADDATAASWNPAGLINLEKPEVSFVYSYFNRSQTYHSGFHSEMSGSRSEMDANDINFASLAVPFKLFDRNMIITLNYQQLYDMNKDVLFNFSFDPGVPGTITGPYHFSQKGSIGALSPAFALQILPELYLGTTINIWDGINGTSQWNNSSKYVWSGGGLSGETVERQQFSFSGLNANFGLLYTLNGKYSLGMVYKTPFEARVTKETTGYTIFAGTEFPATPVKEDLEYSMPASYGIGLAYRHSDRLTVSLDVYRTEWSNFKITNKTKGSTLNPISNVDISKGRPKDTTQVRIGAEYLFIGDKTVIPVRGGMFYDPEPGMVLTRAKDPAAVVDDSLWASRLNDYFGFSVGTGIAVDSIAFDVSYQYRFGNRSSNDSNLLNTTMDTTQHTIMTSLIYHF